MSEQAAQFVGSIPGNYDGHLGPLIFNDFADDLAQRVFGLRPHGVLELAAGTGILTRKLRDLLPADCDITATDLNSPMLDVARTKFESGEGVQFETADATQLPFDDSDFDVLVCQFGVMFFPDKQRSYEEAYRALKPGGYYIFNAWGPLESNPFAKIAHETVAELFPADPPGFYKVPFGYNETNNILQSTTAAGFSNVKIETVDITSTIPCFRDFATGLVFGNPLSEEITARGGEPNSVCSAIADALEHKLGSVMPLQALVVVAHKPQ